MGVGTVRIVGVVGVSVSIITGQDSIREAVFVRKLLNFYEFACKTDLWLQNR